jgi:DNA-binding beta-propeller fold protein YncE
MRLLLLSAVLCYSQIPSPALIVLDKADNTLVVIEPQTNAIKGRVSTGNQPHEVAVSADGRTAYVTNYGTGPDPGRTLSAIDLTTMTERKIDIGDLRRPHGIWINNGKVYFTAEQNKVVARYDPATNRVDLKLPTKQEGTHMVVVNKAGTRLFTVNIGSNSISIFDRGSNGNWREDSVTVGPGPEAIDLSPNEREIWTAHGGDGGVSIINAETHAVTMVPKLSTRPNRLKFTPDGKRVLISDASTGELIIVDTATHKTTNKVKLGSLAEGIQITPDGSRAYVALERDNQVAIVDIAKAIVTGRIKPGNGPDGLAWIGRR